ncbi:hypothetical protein [uncultured Roseibium sp.]|uniref:hypothetical protein n=1 Tax=uncultured Roseibium sp. TaxID=1936171 RepID=UPI0026232DCB|nr:hypothetical protein [uncultured Roseibium sp.]
MPAELEVTIAPVSGRSSNGSAMPAFDGSASASETMVSPATPSNITAGMQDFVRLVNSGDAALYVALGNSPNAAATPRWFLGVGQSLILSCGEGEKVAFVAK